MNKNLPNYAELHCLSNFSFQRGASHPRELVQRAAELGYRALAITDECSLAGIVRAFEAARALDMQLIVGSEIQLADGLRLVLLAADRRGYGTLCQLITRGRGAAVKGAYRLSRHDLDNIGQDDALSGCLALWLPATTPQAENACWLKRLFAGRCWIACELHRGPDDAGRLESLQVLAQAHNLPLVATGDVHMHTRSRRALQDTLTAVRHGCTVAEAGQRLFANGERHLRSRVRLARLYPATLLEESVRIAERCTFSPAELRYQYPHEVVPAGQTPSTHLRALTEDGLTRHWPEGAPLRVREQVEAELALIAELDYEHFFLTVHDIVRFAEKNHILCQGRGSAANSAVCYCLGITKVDPAHGNLLFARFISRARDEPPDIDVDFEHERREEIIQYIYQKYGRHRAALAATVVSYRTRSAIRDVGKALGLAVDDVNRLSQSLAWWDNRDQLRMRLAEQGFDPDSTVIRQLVYLVGQLIGFPRHLSQHVGGFVISETPLTELVPVENAAMADRTIIQWDKDDLETLGFLKVDVLALGMLSAIRRTFDLVRGYRGRCPDMAAILASEHDPVNKKPVYDMIQRADTLGLFQIESRAQQAMLPRLRPARYYDLVVEVAIVRPGPIQGDMVHPYLARRADPTLVSYPGDEVKAVLERTLGVPIFQEQVMQLAITAAGFSPDEADSLRRSMAAWRRRGGLEPFHDRLVSGMTHRGYSHEFSERIYHQILGFGEYGFPESHAAGFALLVYVSAWLKCYEPAAFACALINSQPMGFYAPSQIVQDARRHGVEVRPVDVNASEWDCRLEMDRDNAPAIRLGLRMIKGLSKNAAESLLMQRQSEPFNSVDGLIRRSALSRRDCTALAHAGAFANLAGDRHQAHWQSLIEPPMPDLLATAHTTRPPVRLPVTSEGEDIVADYASVGLTLRRHPLALLRARLDRLGAVTAARWRKTGNETPARVAGIVTMRQRPGTAKGVMFVTLEDETGLVNVVIWPRLVERERRIVLSARLMLVHGVVQRAGEVVHLVAHRIEDRSDLLGGLLTRSRDFH